MDFLSWITDFTSTLPVWLIWALGSAISFAESGLGLGLVFPGETAILIVSAALTNPWSAVVMAVLVTVFACAGDHVGYLLGRRFGGAIRGTRLVTRLGVQHWDRSVALLEKQGARAILFTRPVPIVRILTPAAAGVAGATYPRFLAASVAGAAVWSVLYVGLGYLLRSSLEAVEKYLSSFGWAVSGVLAVVVIGAVTRALVKRHREKSGSSPRTVDSPVVVARRIVVFARRRPLLTGLVLRAIVVAVLSTLLLLHQLAPAAAAATVLVIVSLPWAFEAMLGGDASKYRQLSTRAYRRLLSAERLLLALPPIALAVVGLAPWVLAGTLVVPLLVIGVLQIVDHRPGSRRLPCDAPRAVVVTGAVALILIGLVVPWLSFATGLGSLTLFAAIVLAYVDGVVLGRRLMTPVRAMSID